MEIAFWPAAEGAPWSWAWRPYPGVWALLSAVAGAFLLARRGVVSSAPTEARAGQRRARYFGAGLAVLWLALDWPLGALAGGYLLSAAALQYLLVTLAAAPLLLLSLPRGASDEPPPAQPPSRLWRPPFALLSGATFAVVLFGTSPPGVVDGLRSTGLGSMALTTGWLAAALVLWWPLLRRRPPLGYMAGVAYLFVPFLLPKIPGLVYIVASAPLYESYAEAPRVAGVALSASADQRAAGALLWSAGTALVFISLGVLFFLWYRDERRVNAPGSLDLPADPEVVDALFAIPGAWTAVERVITALDGALPAERPGTELRFTLHGQPGGTRVVLEVHTFLDRAAAATIEAAIARDLAAYFGHMDAERRTTIEARFAVEVVPLHSRSG